MKELIEKSVVKQSVAKKLAGIDTQSNAVLPQMDANTEHTSSTVPQRCYPRWNERGG